MKIAALKARSVRGLPRSWPDLPVGDNGLVIYGPNGVGKSSIVDAFEFALTQQSTLFPENRLGVSWDAAAPHIKTGPGEIAVELIDGSVKTEIGPDVDRSELTASVAAWIGLAEVSNFVLRRHMLLRFINERPQDRYALLAPFCNLGSFQIIEESLHSWVERLETERVAQATKIAASEQRLRQVFKIGATSSVTGEVLVARINLALGEVGAASCSTTADLKDRKTELQTAIGGKDRTDRLAALGGLKNQAQRLGRILDLLEALGALLSGLNEFEKAHAGRVQDVLIDLLAEGKRAIEAAGLTSCPLCEQPIDRSVVLARIDERIREDEHIARARQTVAERRKILERPLADLSAAFRSFAEQWAGTVFDLLPPEYAQGTQLIQELLVAVDDKTLTSARMEDLLARTQASLSSHDGVVVTLDGLIAKEGGGEQRNKRLDAIGMIDAFLEGWAALQLLRSEYKSVGERKRIIERIHGHAVEARKAAVQTTLDRVSGTANSFYASLHPGENIGASKLAVRQVGQGSINLTTEFYGEDEHPLLHHSESHLDTLGLCYFLALRKHEAEKSPSFRLLILDDVMHSVDAEHRGRVARLLRDEFADHQIIITTHDVYFYDTLRKTLGSSGIGYQTISGWDIARGPILGDPLTDLDIILDKNGYSARRSDDLSACGGRFFEWVMKQLDERLQVSIAARFERRHDVTSLWQPLCAKLKRQRGFAAAYPLLAQGLDSTVWVRNACGAHDNRTESAVTPREVHEFVGYLADLYSATHCNECETFIARQPDDGWRCDCGKRLFSTKV
jgi:energy-coupling factor transporter ATP-binding protein EcfA2